ncbi:MAG: hypothetical protein LW875_05690 [Proteobacteria bacterium]|jgi:hypothetical protein|nr:hypothetical protein [Pseudomonadota bacterium]
MPDLFERLKQSWYTPYLVIFIVVALYSYRLVFIDQYFATAVGADSISHIPNNYDYCTTKFMWGETKTDKFHFPFGVDLRLNYDQPFMNFITCPMGYIAGPIAMFNFYCFLQILFICWFSWAYISKHVRSIALKIGFVLFFGMCGYTQNKMMGQPNLMSTIWALPLIFYFFEDLNLKNLKRTLVAFAALAMALGSAWQNSPNLFLIVVFFVIKALWGKEDIFLKLRNLTFSGVMLIALLFPMVGPMFLARQGGEFAVDQTGMYIFYGDLLSLIVLPFWHWMYKFQAIFLSDWEPFEKFWPDRALGLDMFLFGTFVYFVFSNWKEHLQKWKSIYVLIGGVYFLLFLGPKLSIGNHEILDLDYFRYIQNVLPFSMTRNPARYGTVLMFLIVLFTTIMIERKSVHLPLGTKRMIGCLFIFLGLLHANLPGTNFRYPVMDYKADLPYAGIEAMAKAPRDSLFVTVPVTFLPNQFGNFAQMQSGLKQVTGYLSYTILSQRQIEKVSHFWGGLMDLTCPYTPEQEQKIRATTNDLEPFLKQLDTSRIRFLVIQSYVGECSAVTDLMRAFVAHPRVSLYESAVFKILEIKKAP